MADAVDADVRAARASRRPGRRRRLSEPGSKAGRLVPLALEPAAGVDPLHHRLVEVRAALEQDLLQLLLVAVSSVGGVAP